MSTSLEIAKKLKTRYFLAKLGFIICLTLTMVTNILLSLYADKENNYGIAPGRGLTISHSMTGSWSRPVANILIFIGTLYMNSIALFNYSCQKQIMRQVIHNGGDENIVRKIWVANSRCYVLSIISVTSLLALSVCDVRKRKISHLVFTGIFFLSIYTMMFHLLHEESLLRKLRIVEKKNWYMCLSITMMLIFTTLPLIAVIIRFSQGQSVATTILIAIGEYSVVMFG